jgi:DNA replication protein DnaC
MSVEQFDPEPDPGFVPPRPVTDQEWAAYQQRSFRALVRAEAQMPQAARAWWKFRMKVLGTRAYEHRTPSGHAGWDAAYHGIRQLIERHQERDHGAIIALCGPHGLGKTVMATGLVLLVTHRLERATYTKLQRFQRGCEEARQPGSETPLSDYLLPFRNHQLVVIDDCSAGYDTDASQRLLRDLLDDRYEAGHDTLLVSNDSRAGFEEFLGTATLTRVNHTGGLIPCQWESFRE